jgi:hypothetical protein
MLPFTQEQFFSVFRDYNAAIWPASIFAYGLGIMALVAMLQPHPHWSKITASILAVMWVWTGVAYHGIFFSTINSAALLFAALFVTQAVLFIYFGLVRDLLQFGKIQGFRALIGWTFVAYAAIAYPFLGIAAGRGYGELPQFGITPCPVAVFTFGVLLLARLPFPRTLFVIPFLWSLIGGSAAILLAIPQDWLLLVSGVMTGAVLHFFRSAAKTSNLRD